MIKACAFDDLLPLDQPISWAMGFFDGMHLGHQEVIAKARAMADAAGGLCGLITFSPHPMELLAPERAPKMLTPDAGYKAQLAQQCGVDVFCTLPFTTELAQLSPHAFIKELQAACSHKIIGFSVGGNWHFGRLGAGDAALLKEMGLQVQVSELRQWGGGLISSSRIRACLEAGQLAEAQAMLTRPFTICGEVEHGQHLARQLGMPTANISLPANALLPPLGVYAVECVVEGLHIPSVANLGLRPTIDEARKIVRLETHLINWSGNLYGLKLEARLRHFIRPEQKFDSLDALKKQMLHDFSAAHAYFR